MKISRLQSINKFAKIQKKQKAGSKMNLTLCANSADENCVQYGMAKTAVKEFLKNEDVLYKLYLGEKNPLFDNYLKDEEFLNELYQDPEFMQASVGALYRAADEKIKDNSLNESGKKALIVIKNILLTQKRLFSEPDNSFLSGLKNNPAAGAKKRKNSAYFAPNELQLAFGSIFNYGFLNKPKSRRKRAEAIVNRYATTAAAQSGAMLWAGSKIRLLGILKSAEPFALSDTTRRMCKDVCAAYEMPGYVVTNILAQMSGAAIGEFLAGLAPVFFPGAGNIANAAITYSLHQIQGRAIINWCEKNYNNPDIKNWDELAAGLRSALNVNALFGNPVGKLIANNPPGEYIDALGRKEDFNEYIQDVLG